jgi:prenylcysteine oxidase/farnesylcysteine lyase
VYSYLLPGAGSAGSSAAYYLTRFASNETSSNLPPLNITIFERASYIGGRSTIVDIFGNNSQPVELGASIFVSINNNLVDAVNVFGLSINDDDDDGDQVESQILGIWNGEQFVYTQELAGGRWSSWWSIAKLVYRYGVIEPYRTRNLMRDTVARFLRMYSQPIFPFASLTEAVDAAGLSEVTGVLGVDYLKKHGVQGLFAQELVQASTRVNYAQDLDYIHGVEAMVCMATDGAMSVRGGNWRMFDAMTRASGAGLKLETEVQHINKTADGRYILSYNHIEETPANAEPRDSQDDIFDAIIIAAPYHQSRIAITPPPQHIPSSPDYVNLHVTLFSTPYQLSPTYFDLEGSAKVPDMILTTVPLGGSSRSNAGLNELGFFSVSQVRIAYNPDTNSRERVFKIFSSRPVSREQLELLIDLPASSLQEPISWQYHKMWQSYPYLPPTKSFDDIRLDGEEDGKGIWYTSGIEQFISTMETSSLSGMNVAKLVVDELVANEEHDELKI